jgi:hypothetical protein
MARHEEDREDLLREATALVERAELRCAGASIVVGFRRDGSASFFLSPEEVYQFNSAGELRRAFSNDRLYKADDGKLYRLTRQRGENSVNLVRHELAAAETGEFLSKARSRLAELFVDLQSARFQLIGSVPEDADVVGRTCGWLGRLPERLVVAAKPGIGRQR